MLNKEFIAGFICGEGSFSQWSIKRKDKTYKVFRFCITQHEKEMGLLEEIKNHLGYGIVRRKSSPKNNPKYIEFMITRSNDLIKFFNEIFTHLRGSKKEQAKIWYQDLKNYRDRINE